MIVLPPNCRDEAELHVYFEGIRSGVKLAAARIGQPRPGNLPGKVTAQHLLSDFDIIERQALELFRAQQKPSTPP